MSWKIQCSDLACKKTTYAKEIVDLISNFTDTQGYFICKCGRRGYIKKEFELQEEGEYWKPFLRGVITLGNIDEPYQPFVFTVSYTPDGEITDIWFSYYKDLRSSKNGRLKLGYGRAVHLF